MHVIPLAWPWGEHVFRLRLPTIAPFPQPFLAAVQKGSADRLALPVNQVTSDPLVSLAHDSVSTKRPASADVMMV